MRIGILSDSHGRAVMTRTAVRALLDAGSEMLIHLGDIETANVIDELVNQCPHPAHIVFGNCDFDEKALARYAQSLGICIDHPIGSLSIDEKTISFTHGHMPRLLQEALASGVDYLLHGHSHETRDERLGCTRIINPGALFRAPRYTAAVLDPASDSLDFIEIPRT